MSVLAIDQGTTNSKALLIGRSGRIVASGSSPLNVAYPRPGWVETSGRDIWKSVLAAVAACLRQADDQSIAAIGISNQRESVLVWDRRTGEPVGPCIIWQCRRTAERVEALRDRGVAAAIEAETGLGLDPLFPASKIAWLLDQTPDARAKAAAGAVCAGTVDAWLLFNLTGGAVHATDSSNASRTQLMNIRKGSWSAELAGLFDVPLSVLPEIRASDSRFGETVAAGPLRAGIPIHGMIGDSHAALFGHGVRAPGIVKATYGTGSSLMTLTDEPRGSRHGLSTTIAWNRSGRVAYAFEGNITVSAQAAAFAAEILGLAGVDALTRLAESVLSSEGVYFVPALAGLGAPHWDTNARGLFAGMSLATRPAHLARATLEAIAFQVGDVFFAMEGDLGAPLAGLSADGGATANDLLMQIQADLIDRPVARSGAKELSAVGAGVMAGVAAGIWDDAEAGPRFAAADKTFRPGLAGDERAGRIEGWRRAIRATLRFADLAKA
jgi:glycerol kinase